MARKLTIPLSDALEAKLTEQAQARGTGSIDECVIAILNEALTGPPVLPADRESLERELLKGMDGSEHSPTPEDWQRKKDELIARHRRSKAG